MYLTLAVEYFFCDDTFIVHRRIRKVPVNMLNSVIKIDYEYRPWPRVGDNLLW